MEEQEKVRFNHILKERLKYKGNTFLQKGTAICLIEKSFRGENLYIAKDKRNRKFYVFKDQLKKFGEINLDLIF